MFNLNHLGQQQFNAGVACTILSGVAVATRLYCKLRHKQGVRSDDWWILMALAWYWASVACVLWGSITGGGGKEMKEMLAEVRTNPVVLKHMSNYIESMFLGFTFLSVAIFACKISILLFYRHIFFITDSYRRASVAMIAVSTAWFIATMIADLTTCQPIESFWNRRKPGKCFNFNAMFLGTGIADTIIDVVILLLPIRMVLKLQLPKKTKVAVAGIFALGGFVIITNIIRISNVYQPGQQYVSFAEAERWSNIHMVTAFTCACLPVYKPLWTSISTGAGNLISRYANSLRSLVTSRDTHSNNDIYLRTGSAGHSEGTSMHSDKRNLESTSEHLYTGKQVRSTTTVIGRNDDDRALLNVPRGGIAYSREVNIV